MKLHNILTNNLSFYDSMYSCLVIIPTSFKELVLSLKTSHKNNRTFLRAQCQSWTNRALCQGKRKTLSHPWRTSNLWSFGSSFCKRMILETLKWCEMAIVSSWSSHVFCLVALANKWLMLLVVAIPNLRKLLFVSDFFICITSYIYILRLDI